MQSPQNRQLPEQMIKLKPNRNGTKWKSPQTAKYIAPEEAALHYYRTQRWEGSFGEGGLILLLLKAASLPTIGKRDIRVYTEAIYYLEHHFPCDHPKRLEAEAFYGKIYSPQELVANVISMDESIILDNIRLLYNNHFLRHDDAGLTLRVVKRFYYALGRQRLHQVASIFARDPYRYRAGWPDLTLFKDHDLQFVEVKTPNDKLRFSQKDVIEDILWPLGLNVILARVQPPKD